MAWRRWLHTSSAVCAGVLAAAILAWFVHRIASVIWLFIAGFLVAYILDPLLDRLEARGWSRLRAVAVVTAVFAIGLGLVLGFVGPALFGQAQQLATNFAGYSATIANRYEGALDGVQEYLGQWLPGTDLEAYAAERLQAAGDWLQAKLPQFLRLISDNLVRSVSLVGTLLLVGLISFYFMLVIDPFRQTLRSMVPSAAAGDVDDITTKVNAMLAQYVRGQATMMLIAGCLATMAMLVVDLAFGSQYALVVGLMTGVLSIVPYIGAALTTVTAAILTYASSQHDPLWAAIAAIVALQAVNVACDQLISPRVIGQRVGLHPLLVLFGMLAGYQVFGFVGMIVAAPTAASIKIILARWIPVRQVEAPRGKPAPLWLDLQAAATMARNGFGSFARRIEDAIGMSEPDSPPSQEEDAQVNDDDPATP